jgi:uroporphyrinogen decarboxylase
MMTTSRERVLQAVDHQQPDRVPIDLSGHRASGISAMAYHKLKQYLGIQQGAVYVYDMIQQLAIIEPMVMERFGVDTIELGRGFNLLPSDWQDWELPDGTPCKIPFYIHPVRVGEEWRIFHDDGTLIAVQRPGCNYFEQVNWPLAGRMYSEDASNFENLGSDFERSMWTAIASPPAPLGMDEKGLKQLAAGAKALRQSSERAIVGLLGANLLEMGQFLFGMENFFTLLASEPSQAHRFLDKVMELHLEKLRRFVSAVGPYIDIIQFNDDLGMQTGPQISVKMYKEFFHPRFKLLFETSKKLTGARIMLHSCGGIYPLLPYLVEAGMEILQPVQTSSRGMEPERLKSEFGKDICFWGGGCDTQYLLGRGTPEQVAADVRHRVEVFAPGGGFVFQQIHNIQADVPPENIVAMFDAIDK